MGDEWRGDLHLGRRTPSLAGQKSAPERPSYRHVLIMKRCPDGFYVRLNVPIDLGKGVLLAQKHGKGADVDSTGTKVVRALLKYDTYFGHYIPAAPEPFLI